MQALDIGLIGLAVMGRSLALNMADHGFQVAGYNRSSEVTEEMVRKYPHENFTPFYSLEEMVSALVRPRKLFLMVQAGAPVDAVINQLLPLLEPGDIILDGGNSYFEDTQRRFEVLKSGKIHYFGVGVSGGENGARFGPSIMPGGKAEVYKAVQPILEAIAARAEDDGSPCCTFIGPDGAGHYVKMVHNGIEYADMQLIAEAYLLLKQVGGFDNHALSDIFRRWNEGELHSYLIGITADILQEADDQTAGELVDRIEDSAQQKGTGRWTSIQALKQGVNISMITEACNARILSNRLEEREEAKKRVAIPEIQRAADLEAFVEMVREGLYTAKIAAYAQGFALLRDASESFGWSLDLGKIASIFRAGCIIQAAFLKDITQAFQRDASISNLMLDEFFLSRINRGHTSLRQIISQGILSGLPLPVLSSAVSYLDGFRGAHVGANLIQGQRDYFGAHTYRRIDQDGVFHHEWGQSRGK